MTHEHGYRFPEASDDTRCECGGEYCDDCDICGDPVCVRHEPRCVYCEEKVEAIELNKLWYEMDRRSPSDILYMAWAHSQNGRDISTEEHEETVWIFKASLAMIQAGRSAA